MTRDAVNPELVKGIFRDTIRTIFGENGSKILELHLRRVLNRDPYDALYDNPKLFCDGLRSFFGNGTRGLLRIIAGTLIKEYKIQNISPDHLVSLLDAEDPGSRILLFNLLCASYHSRGGGA